MASHSWGSPKLLPAPKVVSSGSVSKPKSPGWGSPRPLPGYTKVQA